MTSPSRAKLASALAGIWERSRDAVLERVSAVEDAAMALVAGTIDPATRRRAAQEAHKLAGTAGTFGYHEATDLAREAEQVLAGEAPLDSSEVLRISQIAVRLRDVLEQPMDVSPTQAERETPQPAAEPTAMHTGSAVRRRALAVDDDPHQLAALESVLRADDFDVTALTDPLQFWDALTRVRPDVVVLDIDMPGATGIELLRAIRASAEWSQLVTILVSARTGAEVATAAFAAGADDFLPKPYAAQELLTRIARQEGTRRRAGETESKGAENKNRPHFCGLPS